RDAGLDALVCALPRNVLLLSGYWPVLGDSVAIIHGEELILIVPRDEVELATAAKPDRVLTFQPATLAALKSPQDVLQDVFRQLPLQGTIGVERNYWSVPVGYSSLNLYGGALDRALVNSVSAKLISADDVLS